MGHTECGDSVCAVCGEPCEFGEAGEVSLLVSVQVDADATFDCVLPVHGRCAEAAADDVPLLNVRALGKALVHACEVSRFVSGAGAAPQVKRPEAKAARRVRT